MRTHGGAVSFLLSFISLIAVESVLWAGVSSYESSTIELNYKIGNCGLFLLSGPISADFAIENEIYSIKSLTDTVLEPAAFNGLEYGSLIMPGELRWKHAPYFVRIFPDEDIELSVDYWDRIGNSPSAGYPKAAIWQVNTGTVAIISLEKAASGYAGRLRLSKGIYFYQYKVKNDFYSEEFCLAVSSFVVTGRPRVQNPSDTSEKILLTSGACLSWDELFPEGQLSFKVFLGPSAQTMRTVYEGNARRCGIRDLENGREYSWQVEAVNPFGVSSFSPVLTFKTVDKPSHAFNYPNPFNPASGQPSRIVFHMNAKGSANINVYSEQGDLQRSFECGDIQQGTAGIIYDGKDDNGKILYNGSYICVIHKIYASSSEKERCRILIVK